MRLNATRLGSIASSRSFGDQLDDLAGQVPSLDLNFAQNKSLIDDYSGTTLATHTRASSATFVDSTGVLRTAVTNLNTNSEAFDTYGTSAGSVSANAGTAPNGTLTADELTSTGGGVFKSIGGLTSGATYVISVYAKYISGGTNFLFGFDANPSSGRAVFNLQTGAFVSAETNVSSYSITPVGNGWHRVTVTAVATSTSAIFVFYNGTSGSKWFLWGAQLEQSSTVGEYIPTTSTINSAPRFDHNPQTGESLGLLVEEARTNLALRSEEFSDATWVKVLSTVTANTGSAPDGTVTADTFTRTTTGANYVTQNFTKAASAIQYTCSVFAKQSVGNFCAIRLQGTYPSRVDVVFDLSSATISTAATAFGSFTGPSASITPYANGWYRLTVTGTSDATVGLVIHTSFSSNGAVIDGNDSVSNSAGLLWGAQLEAGAFPTSYIPTTSATVTRAADVAQITGSNFGVTRTNLLVRSEEFDTAGWAKLNSVTVGANATAAPNGAMTADKIIEPASSTDKPIVQLVTLAGSTTYTASIYFKAAERSTILFHVRKNDYSTRFGGFFNTSTNTFTPEVSSGGVLDSFAFSNIGGGWYRCSITGNIGANTAGIVTVYLANSSNNISYAGDGTSGIFLWGAQLEVGSAVTPYIQSPSVFTSRASSGTYVGSNGLIQTATTNLLLRSEEFDSGWTGSESNTTVTANTSTAPNGTITADTINFTNASSFRYQSVSNTPAGTTYTFSVWLASGTKTQTVIRIAGSSTGTGSQFVVNLTPTLTRYSVTVTIPSGNTGAFVGFENRVAVGGGDGSTGTIIVWGAQLEQSSTVGEYIPTTSSINSAARYDHDPVSLISRGLLLEEARTNLALDSEDFSAATWTRLGTTYTVDTVASPTGATTADTLLETATTTEHILYSTAPHTFTTATHSIYVKPNGRTNVALRFFYANDDWVVTVFSLTGNGSVTQSSAGSSSGFSAVSRSIANAGNGWYRISMTATQTSRATFAAVLDLCTSSTPTLATASGSEVYLGDVTRGVYAWGSQLEAASTVSSYIPTTGSTVTRAADISTSVATSVFESSWYRQTEGTFYGDAFRPFAVPASDFPLIADSRVGTDRIQVGYLTEGLASAYVQVSGVAQAEMYPGSGNARNRKVAFAATVNNFGATCNGAAVLTDTSGTMPAAMVSLGIGSHTQNSQYLNGHIRRLAYWPTRLSNEVLQRITQP